MLEILAATFAFVSVTAIALYLFMRVPEDRVVEKRLGTLAPKQARAQEPDGVLRRETGTFGFLEPIVRSGWADRWTMDLQGAGLAFKVSEYLLVRVLLGVLLAMLMLLLTKASGLGLVLALVAGVVGYMIPAWYAKMLRGRRVNAINAALVEALQLIANSLRAGFALNQSIEMANRQLQPPIRDEFERYLQDIQLGAKQEEAMEQMAVRTGSYDVGMMVTTVLVQKTTGGNLSEILDIVADTIRERERLQGEIRALTASQRLTGLILSLYPLFLLVFFTVISYDLMRVLWEDNLGRIFLATAITLQVIGIFVIRRILRLDV